jgi:hypothetical protein
VGSVAPEGSLVPCLPRMVPEIFPQSLLRFLHDIR